MHITNAIDVVKLNLKEHIILQPIKVKIFTLAHLA